MTNQVPIYMLLLFISLTACSSEQSNRSEEDRLLASVYNKSLYMSDLEGIISAETTRDDSSLILNAYVQRWVKSALVLYEAEQNIPQDLNIDELVRDYRASLIRHNYEQLLVDQMLDSTITKEELTSFYNKHKEQYQLERPVMRCYFIKVPRTAPSVDGLRRWWDKAIEDADAYGNLVEYCSKYAEIHFLDDRKWYGIDEIAAYLPPNVLTQNNVETKKDFVQRDGQHQYFFKAFEVVSKKEIAPLGYIEDQARKFILRQRKMELLEDIEERMYEKEMRQNNIKVYIK